MGKMKGRESIFGLSDRGSDQGTHVPLRELSEGHLVPPGYSREHPVLVKTSRQHLFRLQIRSALSMKEAYIKIMERSFVYNVVSV